ncbi:hypothetical protein Naga_100062g5 [Nannochloropsis gaditana]|uniref:RPA-interacting protein C-terminal domain-containing protein n=1 Tax=Nannochloropsis gaditana TaxID=72520 RepID=W7TWA6_9STRA|nr:hypothetical protein Naga_100062g5 [Nannochloropsis gaditana]
MDQSTRRKPRPGLKTSAEAFFTTTASTATQRENPAAASSTSKSSGWKDRLKERCLNHVHRERGRLIQELRGLKSPPPRALSSHVPSEPLPSSTLSPSLALLRPSESSSPSLCFNPSLMGSTVMSILQSEMRVVRMSCEEGQAHGADGKLNDDGINGFRHGENEDQSFEPRYPPRPIFASNQGHATPPSGSWLKEGGSPISRSVAEEEDRATTEYEAGGLEDLSEMEQLELMRCIEEALEAEVMAADAEALEEYSQLESSDIEASVQALYDCHTLSHDDIAVLCPCCKSNFLLNHNEDIACACGLRGREQWPVAWAHEVRVAFIVKRFASGEVV